MTPWLQDPDITLYHGDNLDVLRTLPDKSVHMCCTSPPFYGLRDYGTGTWEGGDPGCDHKAPPQGGPTSGPVSGGHRERGKDVGYAGTCKKCGARRVDRQIGLEETPDQWVQNLVRVFREVRRVLRDDGTLWVEIGDSYTGPPRLHYGDQGKGLHRGDSEAHDELRKRTAIPAGMKQKDLLGQPWLLAFALRADGWYLRSEIIWARPNPMPESVTDRPTKSHSTVFLLSKAPRYYFDADAIRETAKRAGDIPMGAHDRAQDGYTKPGWGNGPVPSMANARSVWTIPTQPTPFAHFATWPEALVRRMILAGTSERGCCPECGAPWVRDTERTPIRDLADGGPRAGAKLAGRQEQNLTSKRTGLSASNSHNSSTPQSPLIRTVGWSPSCVCHKTAAPMPAAPTTQSVASPEGNDGATGAAVPVPCTVLDPFAGSATTNLVARHHGRHSIGIELNETYLEIAAKRLQQLSLLA